MSDDLTLDDLPQPEEETTVHPDKLSTDSDNPNEQSDRMFGLLCENMRQKGWIGNAIVADENGVIADGEHRLRAAREIGLTEVPVKFYDIDDAERRLWRLELNKISGEHDSKRDALEYDYLLDNGMAEEVHDLTSAAEEDLDELLAEIKVSAESPVDYEYDPDHNIYFEDCVEGMRERLEDDSVDLLVTDPPYGVDYCGGRGEQNFDIIQNDENAAGAVALYRDILAEAQRVLKTDGHLFVFTRWDVYPDFYAATCDAYDVEDCVVWNKNNWGMGHSQTGFRPKHEFIIHAHTSDARALSQQEPDVLDYNRADTNDYDHPTQKPVPLLEHLITLATDEGDTILDPFMGSGTTAVAAIQNNRDYVGFELDEENYRSVIEKRIGEAKRQMESSQNSDGAAEPTADD